MLKLPKFYVSINLTNRCNLNCKYCTASVPFTTVKNDITLSTVKYVVKMINMYLSSFNIYIILTGGEPLVYPYLNETVNLLYTIKNISRIDICTNGTLPLKNVVENNSLVFYSLSYHANVIYQKQLVDYHKNFIENLNLITSNNFMYNIKFLDDFTSGNNIKSNYLNDIISMKLSTENVIYPSIMSTPYFKLSKRKISNQHYNKYVFNHRAINITRNILFNENNKIKYIFSYICDMNDNSKYKSLYSIKEWKLLPKKANENILCNKEICYCDVVCYEID